MAKRIFKKKTVRRKLQSKDLFRPKKRKDSSNVFDEQFDEIAFFRKQELNRGRIHGNEEKARIARDMLERYTGHHLDDFQQQIILTNFHYYVERFNSILGDTIYTQGSAFKAATSKRDKITIIEFGVGSAVAALIVEILATIRPKAVLFLGLCGAVHRSLKVGDFILPIASVRAEGVSRHFLPPQVPALPTFKIQKFISQILVE